MSLPAGWASCELAELASFINGDRGKNYPAKAARVSHGVPFINAGHLAFGRVDMREMDFISRERFELLGSGKVHPGDLLFCLRGSLGKAALVTANEGAIASSLVILRPTGAATPEYLLAYLQSPLAASMVARYDNGTAQPNLSSRNVERFLLPLAPASEQARIVDALDSHLTRIDAAVASLESAQRKLKAYRASVLKAAVEGRLVPTEAELARIEGRSYEPADALLGRILKERRRRWEEAELAKMQAAGKVPKDDRWKAKYSEPEPPDVADLPNLPEGWCWATALSMYWDAGYGTSAKCTKDGNGPAVLRIPNIVAGTIDLDDLKFTAGDAVLSSDGNVQPGDFLFIRTNGSRSLIGRGALVLREADTPLFFASYLIRLRLLTTDACDRWFALAWGGPGVRAQVLRVAASSAGQHNVSLSAASSFAIPLPPAAEQARILAEFERLDSAAAVVEEEIAKAITRNSRLRQTVLKSAFDGTLVDQDPDDEPADLLLSRIRSMRDAASSVAQPKARRSRRLRPAS